MTSAARVVLADDHLPTRVALREALELGGFVVCGEAGNAAKAVALAEQHRPELCVLDVHMPGNGITAAARIAERVPEAAVVMWTVSRDDDDLFEAIAAGARGYILKDTPPDRLPDELRRVVEGEAALPGSLLRTVLEHVRRRDTRTVMGSAGPVRLSDREWEVLELLHEGLSTAEMAERLFVAKVTVRSHVAAVLRKLGVTSRDDALRLLRDEPPKPDRC